MANIKFEAGLVAIASGLVDLTSETTIKAMLVDSTYVAAATTGDSFATTSAGEVTGTGYTAGGKTLTSTTVTEGTGTAIFDAANITWTTSTITAAGLVIWADLTTDVAIALIDFGGNKASVAGDFTITWDAAGIFTLS